MSEETIRAAVAAGGAGSGEGDPSLLPPVAAGARAVLSPVAAGVAGSDEAYSSLLRSIVEVARAIFSAQRSSIFLLDEEADELVFEALAGDEEQGLIGTRMPSSTGIAGWTLVTRQPLVIENLEDDARHSREVAEKTGYVPKGI